MTTSAQMSPVSPTVEIDGMSNEGWTRLCREFRDANVYQSWPYGVARSGAGNLSHLVLRRGAVVIAACQVRLTRFPLLPGGVAFVRWGPLCVRQGTEPDPELFRAAIRALRAEYVVRRGLVLRLKPQHYEEPGEVYSRILREEGFELPANAPLDRTLLIDLSPPLEDLSRGLHQKWRYNLNKARKQGLELIQGTEDAHFAEFESIYAEMVDRKRLLSSSEVGSFRTAQKDLAPEEKAHVILCRSEGKVCAGGICSAIGDTGIYLLGATSNQGIKTFGSYLVHWRMLEWVKERNCRWYDLNGINPQRNPGGYQFKLQLSGANGRDVRFLGQHDAYPGVAAKWLLTGAEAFRTKMNRLRDWRAKTQA